MISWNTWYAILCYGLSKWNSILYSWSLICWWIVGWSWSIAGADHWRSVAGADERSWSGAGGSIVGQSGAGHSIGWDVGSDRDWNIVTGSQTMLPGVGDGDANVERVGGDRVIVSCKYERSVCVTIEIIRLDQLL